MEFLTKSKKYNLHCSQRNLYTLDMGYKVMDLTFCQLLAFRNKILTHTSYERLEEIIENDNFILLFVADKQHLLYLDIASLLELKNILLAFFCEEEEYFSVY